MTRYPDKPGHASDGEVFDSQCRKLLQELLGEIRHKSDDVESQIHIGDTLEGDEFKHLQKSFNRLHIEISERKSRASRWVKSGIFCDRKRYICGNSNDIFGFSPKTLRWWHETRDPEIVWYPEGEANATIKSFVLDKRDAAKICLFRFTMIGGSWVVENKRHLEIKKRDAVAAYYAKPGDETWLAAANATKALNGGKWPNG